jgi:hypothetical protein
MRKRLAASALHWFTGLIAAAAIAYLFDDVAHYRWGVPNRLIRQDALTMTGFLGAALILKLLFRRPSR